MLELIAAVLQLQLAQLAMLVYTVTILDCQLVSHVLPVLIAL